MNTTENNKIIAEFMGYEWFEVNKPYIAVKNVNGSVHFRTDWNDLIEVVEKIFKDFYKLKPCPIGLKMEIEKQLIQVNIENVYNACVEFIKWHNEN